MTDIRRPISLQLGERSAAPTPARPDKVSALAMPPIRPRTMPPSSTFNNKLATGEPKQKLTTSASSGSLASFVSSSTSSCSSSSFSPRTPSPQRTRFESPDSPSMILPYLYVGDQAQTQIDTISNLNISYVLSLQSLPKFLDSDIQLEEGDDVDMSARPITQLSETNTSTNATATEATTTTTQVTGSVSTTFPNDSSQSSATAYHYCSPIIKRVKNDGQLETLHIIGANFQNDNQRLLQEPRAGPSDESGGGGGDGGIQMERDDGNDYERKISQEAVAKELLPSMNSSKDYLVKFRSCVNRLIKGKCINISDTFEQYVEKFFDETHNFIDEARRNKCNILVHCKAGISRSPTIAIAYLMKWKRLHLQDAYDFVKRCRPQISPNLNFMGQLMNYERRLLQRGLQRSPMPSPITCCLLSHPCHELPTSSRKQQQHQQQATSSEQPTSTSVTPSASTNI